MFTGYPPDPNLERMEVTMKDMKEIRWHGRGGQGTKTAALLLAEAAFTIGMYAQGFPEYGPERMGAPITAYNRIASYPITVHSNIYEPDSVVIVDETLIESVDVLRGLKQNGVVLVNSSRDDRAIRRALGDYRGKLYIINARVISEETIGSYFPNIPMLSAVVKCNAIMTDSELTACMADSLRKKFSTKPQVVQGNLEAVKRTLEELIL